ncbi:acyl-CoA N-acyltransferase [Sparassis crispa]|uniref:Acyl-CoA N-acyltransferase n=1 Tax=Sparassis crispa TaxID=139825 RepID=A0A401GVL7_9APHY|nr:acyl-CoA N-acyltransferase [Sparassis crispa]GBE86271.1 acyl-CoA N-acyltransferase [Sparassis crispa]
MVQIRRLTDPTSAAAFDRAAEVLVTAFEQDPFTIACTGGEKTLIFTFLRALIAAVALAGEVWVASQGDQDFVGVASWVYPDRLLNDSPDQGEAGMNALFASFPAELVEWWMLTLIPTMDEQEAEQLGLGIRQDSYNVYAVGVHPQYHKENIARALLKVVEDKANSQGKLITLGCTSETNVEIYTKLGYIAKGPPVPITGLGTTGSFPSYLMAKRPAAQFK